LRRDAGCERLAIEVLPILGKSAAAIEPGDGALDDPAFGQHDKTFGVIAASDDFSFEVRQNFRQGLVEGLSGILCLGS
jgi:hypothetical protein